MEEGLWILTSALCGRSLRPSKTGAGCGCNNSGGKEKKKKSSMPGGCGERIPEKRPLVGEHKPRARR